MPKLVVLFLLAVAGLAVGTLLTGADDLARPLPGGLPLGNALTAVAMVLPALVAVLISRPHTWCRLAAKTGLVAAASWLPLSIVLAGNLTLDFVGMRGTLWLALSLLTLVVVMGSLTWALSSALSGLRRP